MVTILKHLKIKIKDHTKLVLSVASVIFWLTAHHVCNFIYPLNDEESVASWWYLKADFYVVIICMCYVIATLKSSSFKKVKFVEDFMIQFGVIFATSNVVDRWILDSRVFMWSAYYPLLLIAFISYFNVKRLNKEALKQANQINKNI